MSSDSSGFALANGSGIRFDKNLVSVSTIQLHLPLHIISVPTFAVFSHGAEPLFKF
ncbi:hypothetical protein CASFOL_036821 [Castilleja foliolosa]|uniref:Uncharacterized protein n=1 Tax=Castilleja foliolosa TaxID=1961234 RepID=A0ABD3BP19_9LAMI